MMFRRMLLLILCLCMALLPAFSLAEQTYTMAGFDGEDSEHDWATNQFFTRMQERTGISFTFSQYTNYTQWQAAKDSMFENGNLPDVLFKSALTSNEMIRYTDSGQLVDLLPLLPEHAPNLWAVLQAHPEVLKAITLPNGKIAALPGIQFDSTQNALWINQKWLTALGLSAPTDLASLKEVLQAFKTRDPNGNGKQDEVPLAFLGPWELKFLSHAYGVAANDYNIYLDDSKTVHYWPNEDSFFALVTELRGMYEAGLIDPEGFRTADTIRRITDDSATLRYGAFFAPTPLSLVTVDMAEEFVVLEPLTYGGKQVYRDLDVTVSRGAFAITSACKDPAALLRWVDVLYTEDGAAEAMMGKEGDVYIIDEDGYWQWKGGMESVSLTTLNTLSIYDTGDMPWLFPQAFYNRYGDATVRRITTELEKLSPYLQKPFPTYTLTLNESDRAAALQSELGIYVDESMARFILGQVDITDETISAFRQGLTQRGMDDMIALWQSVADRLGN